MTLKEKRFEWEQCSEEVLCITRIDPLDGEVTYKTVYVISKYKETYSLYRYFPIDGNWLISADVRNSSLEHCLAELNRQFKDSLPKE